MKPIYLIYLKPADWEKITGIQIIDPDGWARHDFEKDWARPLTFDQFLEKAMMSTTSMVHPDEMLKRANAALFNNQLRIEIE